MPHKLSVSNDYFELLFLKVDKYNIPCDVKEWFFSSNLCVKIVAEFDEQFNNLLRTFKLNNNIKPSEKKEISCFETHIISKLLNEKYFIDKENLIFLTDFEEINDFLDARHAICHTSAGKSVSIKNCEDMIVLFELLLDEVKDCLQRHAKTELMKGLIIQPTNR